MIKKGKEKLDDYKNLKWIIAPAEKLQLKKIFLIFILLVLV